MLQNAIEYEIWLLHNVGNKAVGIMKAGQTFTIEPMINTGKCVTVANTMCG